MGEGCWVIICPTSEMGKGDGGEEYKMGKREMVESIASISLVENYFQNPPLRPKLVFWPSRISGMGSLASLGKAVQMSYKFAQFSVSWTPFIILTFVFLVVAFFGSQV